MVRSTMRFSMDLERRSIKPTSAGTSAQGGPVSMAATMEPSYSGKSIRSVPICNMSGRSSQDCSQSAGVGPNQRNSLKYAGRLTWNLLNDESNPGYYTSGTYYGTAGDILALAVGGEYQNAGAGSFANQSRFGSFVTDLLFEKVLGGAGVFTVNAELKRYWAQDLAAYGDADCFCMFGGTSWTMYGLYLFPQPIGIGKFQPYARYTGLNAQFAGPREEYELGLNYVIAGHNARISTYWRTGNIGGVGTFNGQNLNYGPNSTGQHVDTVVVALQLQY